MSILNKRNIKQLDSSMFYIGREKNSQFHFGNPFSHMENTIAIVKVSTREEAIDCFRKWIRGQAYENVEPWRRLWILNNIEKLRDKDLVCWCSPLLCHGEVYLEILSE